MLGRGDVKGVYEVEPYVYLGFYTIQLSTVSSLVSRWTPLLSRDPPRATRIHVILSDRIVDH